MKFTNRKIKFRVWTGATMEYRVLAGALGHFYVEGMSNKDSACLSEANTIYPEETPLMQFTGLFDKRGNVIYEGDIIQFQGERDTTYSLPGEVSIGVYFTHGKEFCHYGPRVKRIDMDNKYFGLADCCRDFKIIGNIFQNPELLNT